MSPNFHSDNFSPSRALMVMTEGSSVLSAVARRRLHKDGDTPQKQHPVSQDRDEATIKKRRLGANTGASSAKPTKSKKQKRQPTPELTSSGSSEHGERAVTNQFSSLAAHRQPASEIGKIEDLSRGRVRAIVGQGKKSFVTGSYRLWIKSGAVTICGAVLSASDATYRVYAPSSHPVPVIEVLSDTAEVELTSLDEGLQGLAKLSRRHLWDTPDGVEAIAGTFYVLGHHFHMQPEIAAQRELNVSSWSPMLGQICKPVFGDPPPRRPRILVTGKRSTGTSTFVRCLINSFLTARGSAEGPAPGEVLSLDLDSDISEVTPPGLMAIAHIKEPLLGPPFTHSQTAIEIVKTHFVENHGAGLPRSHIADAVCDLAQAVQEYGRDLPMVIHMPSWVADADDNTFVRIWEALKATQVVYLGDLSNSTLSALANRYSVPLRSVPTAYFDTRLAGTDEKDLRVQSYFHRPRHDSLSLWCDAPLTAMSGSRHSLRFSPEGTINAVLLLDPLVDLEDTLDAMLGSICAVVAMTVDNFEQNLKAKVRTEQNGLPRLMTSTMASIPATLSECLGLAYVAEIDTELPELVIYTPILSAQLQKSTDTVLILVHTGKRQHRSLGTEWIAMETK